MSNRTGIKLSPDLLKSHIAEVIYEDREVGGHRAITCHFKMDNGFVVHGTKPSTSVDPANFDVELGKELSYKNTFDQLWQLEAYRALVEQTERDKALQTAEINIQDYIVERLPVIQLAPGVNYQRGTGQTVLFGRPGMKPISVPFYSTDNRHWDESENAESRRQVQEHLRKQFTPEEMNSDLVVHIAKLCHAANTAYCASIGDDSHLPWDQSPVSLRDSVCNGVRFHLTGDRKPSESHESWLAQKESEGWVYGDVKDFDKKTHPCMRPYDELPVEHRTKDYIFKGIVDSFK